MSNESQHRVDLRVQAFDQEHRSVLAQIWLFGDVHGDFQVGMSSPSAGLQRVLPLGAAKRAHNDCHEAAVGRCARRSAEWRLYEVLRS